MLKTLVIGHLGKDAIVKEVNGKNVINFSVAHTEKWKDATGAAKERTTWVECAYWSEKTAIAPYLLKGTQVYVEGRPEAEVYKDKEGTAKATLRLQVGQIQLLGSATGQQQTAAPAATNNAAPASAGVGTAPPAASAAQSAADDLPF